MKNKTKKIFLTVIALIITVLILGIFNITFAGFADYDDETAEKETQNLLEEQKKEENIVGKSTNNYLSSLKVEGLKLYPEFDKQTLEYSIEKELDVNNINILAKTEDSRANVSGTGTVKLQKGENKIRIDVEAESGTVRTYFIKVVSKVENENNEETENITDNTNIIDDTSNETIDANANIVTNNEITEQPSEKKQSKEIISIIILIVVIALIIILFKKDSSKKEESIEDKKQKQD